MKSFASFRNFAFAGLLCAGAVACAAESEEPPVDSSSNELAECGDTGRCPEGQTCVNRGGFVGWVCAKPSQGVTCGDEVCSAGQRCATRNNFGVVSHHCVSKDPCAQAFCP